MTTSQPITSNAGRLEVHVRVEVLAWVLVALMALGLRAISLGAAPLDDAEAAQAMAAWHLVSPTASGGGVIGSPLLFGGAALAFALTGATNAGARFLPMLAGVLLALSPLLFRQRLGRFPALTASLLLAISPTAVGASRRVDGVGLSMLVLVLALAAADRFLSGRGRGYAALAGAALGAALLADFGTPAALLSLLLGVAFAIFTDEEDRLTRDRLQALAADVPWGRAALGMALVVALGGTLLFIAPVGLGSAADQITRFLRGLTQPTPGVTYLGAQLLLYEPGLLLFGLVGAWLASQSMEPGQRFLAGWAVAGVFVALLYRGAQPPDGLWAVVPLAALAGMAAGDLLEMTTDGPAWGVWAETAGAIALLAMMFASLSQYLRAPHSLPLSQNAAGQLAVSLPLDLILVTLWAGLFVILWLTMSSLWGQATAWRGMGQAALIIAAGLALGQSGTLAWVRATSPFEPFNAAPGQPALDRLRDTAAQIGELSVGDRYDVPITMQTDPSGAVAWALRDFRVATYVDHVDPTVDAVLVVTPVEGADPALGSSYVGQAFVTTRSWSAGGLSVPDAIRWILYRSAPNQPAEQKVILWVREDVFRLTQAGGQAPGASTP